MRTAVSTGVMGVGFWIFNTLDEDDALRFAVHGCLVSLPGFVTLLEFALRCALTLTQGSQCGPCVHRWARVAEIEDGERIFARREIFF